MQVPWRALALTESVASFAPFCRRFDVAAGAAADPAAGSPRSCPCCGPCSPDLQRPRCQRRSAAHRRAGHKAWPPAGASACRRCSTSWNPRAALRPQLRRHWSNGPRSVRCASMGPKSAGQANLARARTAVGAVLQRRPDDQRGAAGRCGRSSSQRRTRMRRAGHRKRSCPCSRTYCV